MIKDYFKSKRGFDRLFKLLKQKYESLGRFSGSVILKNVRAEEADELSNFFGKRIEVGTDFKVSFANIEKKLKETKFADFSWKELFLTYFDENITTKKELKETFYKEEKRFYDDIMNSVPLEGAKWLERTLESRDNNYQLLLKRYNKEKEKLRLDLTALLKIVGTYKSEVPTTLTMLASSSGNPHFLDFGTQNNTLFLKVLSSIHNENEPKTTNDKILFLAKNGIYIDSLSNYVITYKLRSNSEIIECFAEAREVLNLSLSNLQKVKTLDTEEKFVFVFENPSILLALKKYDIPCIITSGMPNYVVYQVLEKLIDAGNAIYYNGDFDPEGLVIVSKLKEKFPNIKLFCYEMADYENAKSHERISSKRISKLNQICDEELVVIKDILMREKIAGYQEKNIARIEHYMRNLLENSKRRSAYNRE